MDTHHPTATPTSTPARPARRRRSPLRVIGFSLVGLVGLGALTLGGTATYDAIATAAERDDIRPYGELVPVTGGRLNVAVTGSGASTVVLLPGFGTASPVIDFSPLVDRLQDTHRVVVVEPLGYGLSDGTDRPRTSTNIVDEVHQALSTLGIDRYVLAGHSVAGIYALEYTNAYPDEVQAFVGIDSSVPTQPGIDEAVGSGLFRFVKATGLARVLTAVSGDAYAGLPYTDAQKEQMTLLSHRTSMRATYLDEYEHLGANFRHARSLTFPADLPVRLFVVGDDPEVPGWQRLHREQAASVTDGQVVLLDGGHYLHHTHAAEIAEGIDAVADLGQ